MLFELPESVKLLAQRGAGFQELPVFGLIYKCFPKKLEELVYESAFEKLAFVRSFCAALAMVPSY